MDRDKLVAMLRNPDPPKALMAGWQEEMDALQGTVLKMIEDLVKYHAYLAQAPAGSADGFDLHDLWRGMNDLNALSASVDSLAAIIESKKPKE